jgi:hypothetical protein
MCHDIPPLLITRKQHKLAPDNGTKLLFGEGHGDQNLFANWFRKFCVIVRLENVA